MKCPIVKSRLSFVLSLVPTLALVTGHGLDPFDPSDLDLGE